MCRKTKLNDNCSNCPYDDNSNNNNKYSCEMRKICLNEWWCYQDTSGGCQVAGLMVQYCLAGEEGQEITLEAPQDATPTAYAFLAALEKAVFMMQESRDIIGTGE